MLAVLGIAFAPFGPVAKKDDQGAGELVAAIGAMPPNPSASADAAFSFSAEGARGFECKLDDGRFERCGSPMTYGPLNEGEHIFRVRATAKGEHGPAARYIWRIDLTAPTTTITEQPPDPTAEPAADFSFTASEDVRSFECRLDDDPFAECTSPMSFPGPLEDDKHDFAVRAIDLAGNVGTAATYRWSVSDDRTTRVPQPCRPAARPRHREARGGGPEWEVEETDSPGEPGQIVGQDPGADAEVLVGSTVTVEVPEGTEIAVVPSVVGLSEDEAVAQVERAGLNASILTAESTLVPKDLSPRRTRRAGTELGPEATVEITVSLGSARIELPDLTVRISDDGVDPILSRRRNSCDDGDLYRDQPEQGRREGALRRAGLRDSGDQQRVAFPDGLAAGRRPQAGHDTAQEDP